MYSGYIRFIYRDCIFIKPNHSSSHQAFSPILIAVIIIFMVASSAFAHKSENAKPVHQHIAFQAYGIWPGSSDNQKAKEEIWSFLNSGVNFDPTVPTINYDGSGNVIWPVGTDASDEEKRNYALSMQTGRNIVEGAQEEDFYCPLTQKWFWELPNGEKTKDYVEIGGIADRLEGVVDVFLTHFWDPDAPGEYGLDISETIYSSISARRKAWWYLMGGKVDATISIGSAAFIKRSIPGVISYYKAGSKELAYYYLGRIVHLLTDMSVPAHVHNDEHPWRDNYEEYVGDHFSDETFIHDSDNRGLILKPMGYNDLWEIFYNQAEVTQNFPSNDENGDIRDLDREAPYENGWEWNRHEVYLENPNYPYDAWPVAETDGWVGLIYPNSDNLKFITDCLLPLNMMYIANLYKLFWDTVHPIPTKPVLWVVPDGVNPDVVTFSWEASNCDDDGVEYNLEIYEGDTTKYKYDDEHNGKLLPSCRITLYGRLDPNTTYRWAVFPKSEYDRWNLNVDDHTFTTGDYLSNRQPIASFSMSPDSGYTTDTFYFDASASCDPDGDSEILEYSWDWGDGSETTSWSTDDAITHQYNNPGNYIVTLFVRDISGAVSTSTENISVSATPGQASIPVVTITGAPARIIRERSATFRFSGNDSDGTVVGFYCCIDNKETIDGAFPDPSCFIANSTNPSFSVSELSYSMHEFFVRAKDNDGNLSSIVSYEFTVEGPLYTENSALLNRLDPPIAYMKAGETARFTALFRNMSNVDWKNIDGDPNYIELHSVNANGVPVPSYLYPGDGSKWLDNSRIPVCTQKHETVAGAPAHENAWFEFDGTVPLDAVSSGSPVPVYFRLFNKYWNRYFGEIACFNINIIESSQSSLHTAMKWEFSSGTSEGWVADNHIPNPFVFINDEMMVYISGADPYMSCAVRILPGEINYLKIVGRHGGGCEKGKFYLMKEGWSYFNEKNCVEFDFTRGSSNQTIFVPLSIDDFPEIFNSNGKLINKIRIDPFDQGDGGAPLVDEVYFDYIELGKDRTPPNLEIVRPVLGDKISGGTPFTFSWKASDDLGVSHVKIQVENLTDSSGLVTIEKEAPNTGFYTWIPPDETKRYRVKLTAFDYGGNSSEATSSAFDVVGMSPPVALCTITGTAYDGNGTPLPGVSLFIRNTETGISYAEETDSNGEYSRANIPAGTYSIKAYINGYSFQSDYVDNIIVNESTQAAVVDFTATKIEYGFEGYIKDAAGTPVEGITIKALCGGLIVEDISDYEGHYGFSLPPDTYQIIPESIDYVFDPRIRSLYVGNTYYGIPNQYFTASLKNGDFIAVTEMLGITSGQDTQSAAWADYDNDGYIDLYVANHTNASSQRNKLYHNTGNGNFDEVAELAGVADEVPSLGCVWGDFNGDGHIDLYVLKGENANKLFKNNGDGTFTDVAPSYGLDMVGVHNMCAAFADYDKDGDLDLFVGITNGTHKLFRNTGNNFEEVGGIAGLVDINDSCATSCSWADYNRDGDIDLYVGRQNYLSQLFKNNGDGTFSEVEEARSNGVYGVSWGDFNNDGYPDLFVNATSTDRLFKNNGDGSFSDVTMEAGLIYESSSFGGTAWFDYDNDGWLDIYIGVQGGRLFHNNGDETFTDVTDECGAGTLETPQAVAVADFDYNGTTDIFIGQMNQNLLFRAKDFGNHFISIKLGTADANRFGVGAVVRVCTVGECQYRTVTAGSGMRDMNSMISTFGLGVSTTCDVRVFWPDGTEDEFYDVGCDYELLIVKGSGQDALPPADIDDLTVSATGPGEIALSWTAPGDDGTVRSAGSYEIRYALFELTADNWSAASPVAGEPEPSQAGERESFSITGLDRNRTYYIAIKTKDERGNASGLSNVVSARTSVGYEITDLSSSNISVSSVTLTWTAPEDTHVYDIRYSTSPIDEVSWETATKITYPPEPAGPGEQQSYVVENLEAGTGYFFAVRSVRYDGISSVLSNIVQADTLAPIVNQMVLIKELNGDFDLDIGYGSVVASGDFNGDGYSDIVIPSIYKQVYVHFGSASISSSPDRIFIEDSSMLYAGPDMVSTGDINGDGFSDLIVGTKQGGTYDTGKVFVYLGSVEFDTVADLIFEGQEDDFQFCKVVIADGDINGDGYDDIVVASYDDPTRLYLYCGRQDIESINGPNKIIEIPGIQILPAVVRDLNSDSFDDILCVDRIQQKMYLYNGSATVDNITKTIEAAGVEGQYYDPVKRGYDVCDINGDGIGDLLVGTNSDSNNAYIAYGPLSASGFVDYVLSGEASGDNYGASVSYIGDINGDGHPDFAIGAEYADGSASASGKAYSYLGSSSQDFIPDIVISGQATGGGFGSVVKGIGDVNNDGYDDIAISTQNKEVFIYAGSGVLQQRPDVSPPDTISDLSAVASLPGKVTLSWSAPSDNDSELPAYFDIRYLAVPLSLDNWEHAIQMQTEPVPSSAGSSQSLALNNLVPGVTYYFGIRTTDRWGNVSGLSNIAQCTFQNDISTESVRSFASFAAPTFMGNADFNGDGFSDIIIGEGGYDGASSDEGMASIYLGNSLGETTPDLTIYGTTQSQFLGSFVSFGDFNGDGYDDALIYNGSYSFSIHSGGTVINSTPSQVISDMWPFTYSLQNVGCGDLNGDGMDDIVLATRDTSESSLNAGEVRIYLGGAAINSSPAFIINGEMDEYFGDSLAMAQDINGDGVDDLLVGTKTGKVYLYYGGSEFQDANMVFSSPLAGDGFGTSVAGAGDMNGDGFGDIVVGAPWTEGVSAYLDGTVYIYLGGPDMDSVYDLKIEGAPLYGGNNSFGQYVGFAGDINSDGYDDIVIMQSGFSEYSTCVVLGGSEVDAYIDTIIENTFIKTNYSGDYDGDGKKELITFNALTGEMKSYVVNQNIPPNMPDNPVPTNCGGNVPLDISLSWSGGDPDGDTVTYDLYFGPSNEMYFVATVSDTSYTVSSLDYYTNYSWKVIARDHMGHEIEGPTWSFQTVKPSSPQIPSNLSATYDGSIVCLSWTGNINNEEGYIVERKIGENSPYAQIATTNGDNFDDLDTRTGNTTYYYRIKSFNEWGDSAYSNVAAVDIPNHAPVIVSSPPTSIYQGTTYIYDLRAEDQDGDILSFSATVKPVDMVINHSKGTIIWKPGNSDVGNHQITVKVSDGKIEDEQSYILEVKNVNDAPSINFVFPVDENIDVECGTTFQFIFAASDSDPGTILTYKWILDGEQKSSENYFDYNTGPSDLGTHILRLIITDGDLSDTMEWQLTVQDTIAPTGYFTYSSEVLTNRDVIATLHPSEDVVVTNNGGLFTYTFTENGEFTFELMDSAGNLGSATAGVEWIDKAAITKIITFEGINDLGKVGKQSGVVFSPAWIAGLDSDEGGNGDFANEPSPDTVAFLNSPENQIATRITLPYPTSQVSFFYSLNTDIAPSVDVYFYDQNDSILGTLSMNNCGCVLCGSSCSGDPNGNWCEFEELCANYAGIKYLEFETSGEGQWIIDDFSFLKSNNLGFIPAIFHLLLNGVE